MTETKRNPQLAAPMVMRGFDSYRSPVSEELIQTRREREQDLVRHDCMPAQDVKPRLKKGEIDAG
jgi:hypothetical protein